MADAPGVAPPRSWRIAAVSALWLAIALLAWVLAHWGWRWFGPAPASVSIVVPTGDWAQRVASAHLFGAAAGNAPATTESSPGIGDLRLLGVFSQRDGRGLALFRSSRGPLLVASGQEIGGGVRLVSVRRDGVTLNDAGVVREIALRPAKAGDTRRNATVASGTKSAACGIPAGYTGQVVRLNAELLGGMISAPDAWKTLLQPAAGALVVRDQSGFAGMLGLRSGDRIERANGISLAIPDDIAATVLQPLTRSQTVFISGQRDGQARQWLYLNAGACPG